MFFLTMFPDFDYCWGNWPFSLRNAVKKCSGMFRLKPGNVEEWRRNFENCSKGGNVTVVKSLMTKAFYKSRVLTKFVENGL